MATSICIDDSDDFLNRLFKNTNILNTRLKIIKNNNTKNNNTKNNNTRQKKTRNNTQKRNDQHLDLFWLKTYVSEKTREIVDYNFDDFLKLYNLYQQSTLQINIIENSIIQKSELDNTLAKLPRHFIWDENKVMIRESLIDPTNNSCKYILVKYFFERFNGNIELYYKNNDSLTNIIKVIKLFTKIIGFYAKYASIKKYFTKLPNFKIFYTDFNKCLPRKEQILGQEEINSAFALENEIILYRRQEILKIMIHELQHFYRFDFGGREMETPTLKLRDLLGKTYNLSVPTHKINPTESYAETNATILNTIFSIPSPLTKEKLASSLSTEMMFSIYQLGKLFNFQNINNSHHIYKTHKLTKTFKQNSFAFEYYYLKSKLLFNYNGFIGFINNIHIYNETENLKNSNLLNLKFPRDLAHRFNLFENFGNDLLINDQDFNNDFDKALNIVIKSKQSDKNLRMTKLEIPF